MAARPKNRIREKWPYVRAHVVNRGKENECVTYVVDCRPHIKREHYKDLNTAKLRAEQIAFDFQNKGIEGLRFPTALRVMAQEGTEMLRPYGKTIRHAVDHYVRFLEEEESKSQTLTVEECVKRYLVAKCREYERGLISPHTFSDLRSKCGFLAKHFQDKRVGEITRRDVREFLDGLPLSQRSVANIRTKISQLLNFCVEQEWIAFNPAASIKIRVPDKEVEILSVGECRSLLETASQPEHEALMPFLLFSMFAGLRPHEAQQLDWNCVNFKTRQIEVKGVTSKIKRTRFVECEETLIKWASPLKQEQGLIIGPNFQPRWTAMRQAAGFTTKRGESGRKWPVDVLRHTYASYWLAVHNDRAKLAELMGNSQAIIAKHYRRAIPMEEAKAFWALIPPGK